MRLQTIANSTINSPSAATSPAEVIEPVPAFPAPATSNLMERVESVVAAHSLLQHPFYQAWSAGTLPLAALQDYAREYHAFESAFPRILSRLHSRIERADLRQALLENLWDEEHGAANHQELWLRFAEAIGVPRESAQAGTRTPETAALLDTYFGLAAEAPVAAGIAAVYAYESQAPAVMIEKIRGLREHYGLLDERSLEFFRVHSQLDVEHSGAEWQITVELADGDEDAIVEAAETAAKAWWAFLDGVYAGTC